MDNRYDVVVVGAGIAGSALAASLAGAGMQVLVLESQHAYRDKVRGETVMPWGVKEVKRLGLEEVLLGAGGEYAESFILYDCLIDPAVAEARPLAVNAVIPDVAGTLNVGHPEASSALAANAAARGATVIHGVTGVRIRAGADPSVAWTDGDDGREVSCRMIVGADGRASAVRRQLGIELDERDAGTYGAGLLVRSDSGFTRRNALGVSGEEMFLAFPRAGGLTRLYLWVDAARQREFTGPEKLNNFVARFPSEAFPASVGLAAGEAAGPCGGAPSSDTWTVGPPVSEGAVLIGDAAGWSDPIIGQGLSIAMRDARSVADVLAASDDWAPPAFDGYVEERAERMRRLRVASLISTVMRCTFTDEGRARRARWLSNLTADPSALMQTVSAIVGPDAAPAEAFTDEAVAAVLAI